MCGRPNSFCSYGKCTIHHRPDTISDLINHRNFLKSKSRSKLMRIVVFFSKL